jgi:2-iminobutanoate/2-iminopropanoate deaminase
LIDGSVGEKTKACIKALSAVLISASSSLDKIVKVQIFLTDMKDFSEMNAEYEKWIKHRPARSCVAVKELPKGVNIEIECVALP